ncbi:MAG: hypothetical protein WCI06_09620 [Methylococcaceae bacterium]
MSNITEFTPPDLTSAKKTTADMKKTTDDTKEIIADSKQSKVDVEKMIKTLLVG